MMVDKLFLKAHLELLCEYRMEVQRLEEYCEASLVPTMPATNSMPHTTGTYSDRTVAWVIDKSQQEEYIFELQSMLVEHERKIEAVVQKLYKAKEKTVIRLRYINGMNWDDISFFFYGDGQDYCEQIGWYKQKVQKLHGMALKNIIKAQEKT